MNGVLDWGWVQRNLAMIAQLTGEHVILSIIPVLAAFVISIPLGYLVFRTGRFANVVLAVLGVVYAIPSLALFVVMPVILGTKILNPLNIVVALTIYSVALLVRSVVDGLRSVPATVNSSAAAVGFGRTRRLFRVELPLAMPVIFAGLRVVTVSNIALVSVGAVIGIGALGELFTRSDVVRTRWAAHDVRFHRSGLKRLHHPLVGDLMLDYEGLELPGDPGLILYILTPVPDTPTGERLRLLGSLAATRTASEVVD